MSTSLSSSSSGKSSKKKLGLEVNFVVKAIKAEQLPAQLNGHQLSIKYARGKKEPFTSQPSAANGGVVSWSDAVPPFDFKVTIEEKVKKKKKKEGEPEVPEEDGPKELADTSLTLTLLDQVCYSFTQLYLQQSFNKVHLRWGIHHKWSVKLRLTWWTLFKMGSCTSTQLAFPKISRKRNQKKKLANSSSLCNQSGCVTMDAKSRRKFTRYPVLCWTIRSNCRGFDSQGQGTRRGICGDPRSEIRVQRRCQGV
jgi:hypothetical protein